MMSDPNQTLDHAFAEWCRVLAEEGQALTQQALSFKNEAKARETARQALQMIDSRLRSGRKLLITGLGKSGKIAQKIASTLSSTGSRAVYIHPTEALHGDLGLAESGDVCWAISQSGTTAELLELVQHLKRRDIFVIGQGGNARSQLAALCDLWISAAIEKEACPLELAPMTSTTLALALGDGLAAALMSLGRFDHERFARNHPGGSLGRKLHTRVSDWMLPLHQVGRVLESSSVEDVVVAATEFKQGGVLVVDAIDSPKSLRGIITDGDLRRSLRHREKLFGMNAAQLMTPTPVVISDQTPATEALRLMEERSSQIHVLPVLDFEKKPLGLLRLHDLVRNL